MASRAVVGSSDLMAGDRSVTSVVCCSSSSTSPAAFRSGVWVALHTRSTKPRLPSGMVLSIEKRTSAR